MILDSNRGAISAMVCPIRTHLFFFFNVGPFLKSLLHLLQYCFSFMFFWVFDHEACGILAPRVGIKPVPPALEGRVLTAGPPGGSCKSTPCVLHCSQFWSLHFKKDFSNGIMFFFYNFIKKNQLNGLLKVWKPWNFGKPYLWIVNQNLWNGYLAYVIFKKTLLIFTWRQGWKNWK